MTVPFFDNRRQFLAIKTEVMKSVERILQSGNLILGPEVKKFEEDFAQFSGCRFGIGVNSGTDALKIALRAVGVGCGDEVITAANTASPTVSAIKELMAEPVLVDAGEDFLIDVKKIEKKITAKTKAIVPVHLYGQVCAIDEVVKIAKQHGLKIVEDCAQAHGAAHAGKMVGGFGDAGCFSFYPTKNLGAYGDAGLIVTSDQEIAKKCASLRKYGMEDSYFSEFDGYNSRLDEVQAGILNIKLEYLADYNKRRQGTAARYLSEIKNKKIILPKMNEPAGHVWHQFVIRVEEREKFLEYLKKNKIGFGIHYPYPIHLQTAFAEFAAPDLANSEKFAREIVSLPIFPELEKKEVDYIISTINLF
ncbi:MAG: DegT/DnrJ/EryC1/StrS family aminotransferase [Patescibacteria group bacterium]|nr:DegT/DnrJ/EryC1/StrS family aminotransferase [Patescibacteria group bacterium]